MISPKSLKEERARHRQPLRTVGGVILLTVAVLLGIVAAVIAFFTTSLVTSSIPLLILSAILALLIVTSGPGLLAARLLSSHRKRFTSIVCLGTVLFSGCLAAFTIFRPLNVTPSPSSPSSNVQYWNLTTGSHIAYIRTSAIGTRKSIPVIYLHGGPALPDPWGQKLSAQLAQNGFDVYYYDQIGSGLSNRLATPRDYTVARHIADLEAIRQQIGSEQIMLVAHSWGSILAANYIAAHPSHVVKAIFVSPGPMWPSEYSSFTNNTSASTSPPPDMQVQALRTSPRFWTVNILSQLNIQAAHNLASDQEMDTAADAILGHSTGGQCDPTKALTFPDIGFYASQGTLANMQQIPDPRPQIKNSSTSTLILRGECDYVKWEITREYRTTFSQSRLIYIKHAGHYIHVDQPTVEIANIRAFLLDRPLPLPTYTGDAPPTK